MVSSSVPNYCLGGANRAEIALMPVNLAFYYLCIVAVCCKQVEVATCLKMDEE